MPNRFILLIILFISQLTWSHAQISQGGEPYFLKRDLPNISAKAILNKPIINDRVSLKSNNIGIWHKTIKFAEPIFTNYTPNNSGEWFLLADGTRVWRLSIKSKGAASLNLIFTKYLLPAGAKLFLCSPDGSQLQGAYTSLNNKSTGILPTMPIMGDEIIVEYSEPAIVPFKGEIEIGQVNYDYLGVHKALNAADPGDFGSSESCEEEASCFADWEVERKGIMKIIVDGTELCTGVLIANANGDNTPLVLSASHCFEDYNYQATKALFIFNYECPECLSNIEGTREQSIAGGYMRAYSETGVNKDLDYALVEMSLVPPATYDAYYCGWDIRDKEGKGVTTIHHPSGDVKKLSIDFDSIGTVSLVVDGFKYFNAGHWKVFNWEVGVTEGGSSGAPLFNESHRIIGALTAGSAKCTDPENDFFYKLSLAWDEHPIETQQIKHWLDPDNTGLKWMDGYNLSQNNRIKTITNINYDDSIGVIHLDDPFVKGYQIGNNSSNIHTYAERFSLDDSFKVLGFYFVPFLGMNSVLTPVTFKIWSGDEVPEVEVWSQKLVLKEWIRRQYVDGSNFGTSGGYYVKSDYADKECFIPIETDIELNQSFFIGFELSSSEPEDTFAMYQAVDRSTSGTNTTFFYHEDEWQPFSAHPSSSIRTSMWINAVLELTSVITDTTPPPAEDLALIDKLFVTENHDWIRVQLGEANEQQVLVEGFSLNGSKVISTILPANQLISDISVSELPEGVFLLRFSRSGKQETKKIVLFSD